MNPAADGMAWRRSYDALRGLGLCKAHAALLQEGFDSQRLFDPGQPGLFGASAGS